MKEYRVGIVGCGMIGRQHMEALRRLPNVRVAAAAGRSFESEGAGEGFFQGVTLYRDYRNMLDTEGLDAVHNCTPNSLHYEVNRYALERGLHVFCEKPFTMTVQQAEELIGMAREKKLANAVNYNYRHNAMVQEMRHRVATGQAGQVFLVQGCYLQDWLMYDTDYSWRLDAEVGGEARALADIGSHWFDLAQFTVQSKIRSVCARLVTAIPLRQRPSGPVESFATAKDGPYTPYSVTSDDAGLILVQFENGAYGSLVVSQVSGGHKNDLRLTVDCSNYELAWAQEEADRLQVGSRRGGKQLIYASPGTVAEEVRRYAPLPEGHAVAWGDALKNSVWAFYRSLDAGTYCREEQEYATFRDGLEIMRIVEACMESSRTGQWVPVG